MGFHLSRNCSWMAIVAENPERMGEVPTRA
jgi:hypothetical protein